MQTGPIHRARHRSLKKTASYAAIFGIFCAHRNPVKRRASAYRRTAPGDEGNDKVPPLRFENLTKTHSGDVLNDPHRRPHFADHVSHCGTVDPDHAATAQFRGSDLSHSQRPDRSGTPEVASYVALKRDSRLA